MMKRKLVLAGVSLLYSMSMCGMEREVRNERNERRCGQQWSPQSVIILTVASVLCVRSFATDNTNTSKSWSVSRYEQMLQIMKIGLELSQKELRENRVRLQKSMQKNAVESTVCFANKTDEWWDASGILKQPQCATQLGIDKLEKKAQKVENFANMLKNTNVKANLVVVKKKARDKSKKSYR
jgi:hypothetical protein